MKTIFRKEYYKMEEEGKKRKIIIM